MKSKVSKITLDPIARAKKVAEKAKMVKNPHARLDLAVGLLHFLVQEIEKSVSKLSDHAISQLFVLCDSAWQKFAFSQIGPISPDGDYVHEHWFRESIVQISTIGANGERIISEELKENFRRLGWERPLEDYLDPKGDSMRLDLDIVVCK
jgi:hypothetical protein